MIVDSLVCCVEPVLLAGAPACQAGKGQHPQPCRCLPADSVMGTWCRLVGCSPFATTPRPCAKQWSLAQPAAPSPAPSLAPLERNRPWSRPKSCSGRPPLQMSRPLAQSYSLARLKHAADPNGNDLFLSRECTRHRPHKSTKFWNRDCFCCWMPALSTAIS